MRKHRFQKQLILMQALVTSWRYLFTICDGTEWHQMITLMAFPFANTTLKYVDCILMARVHSADCSLGLLFICMEKKWNASIRCVNNLPPTMKAATCCAASVTWQPMLKSWAEPRCGCAIFTNGMKCHMRHLDASRTRTARLSFSESACCLGNSWKPCSGKKEQEKERLSQSFSFWLIREHADGGQWKETVLHFSREESGTTFHLGSSALWGFSVCVMQLFCPCFIF